MHTQIRRVLLPVLFAFVFIVAGLTWLSTTTTVVADGPPPPDTPQSAQDARIIDIGPTIRQTELSLDRAAVEALRDTVRASELQAGYGVGDTRIFVGLDNTTGAAFLTTYEVKLISDTVEVWVQQDLSYASPIHPDAQDPEHVTQERIVELATAFENVIRPTDVDYFGTYDSLTGTNAIFQDLVPSLGLPDDYFETDDGQRTIILVHNVRDDNYYDPAHHPEFVAGFFSPTFEGWADRNIITIDSKEWNERVGAPAYVYEAVIVHELQHLINADYDDDEETWANEGRSELAEFIAGYRPTPASHRTTWSDYPENSLTVWGDQNDDPDQEAFEILADYQEAYWFFLYLTGRIVDESVDPDAALQAVAATTQDPDNGIDSINAMLIGLPPYGMPFTFDDVWDDFRTAVLFGGDSDGTTWGDYVTTYTPTSGLTNAPLDVGRLRQNLNFEGYDTPGAPPYGSDYIEIGWSPDITPSTMLSFTGQTVISTSWRSIPAGDAGITPTGAVTGNVLYSGHSDLNDNFVIFETTVPTTGDQSLAFDTLYDIELSWDYGFVQVATDTTNATGFTSLDISGTITATADNAHPIIKANVPGFSGVSGAPGWVHVEHDLSAYAGEDILLAFRYSTDWATAGNGTLDEPGWYLDNVSVGGTDLYTDTLPSSARSIWQARGNGYTFSLDFVTFADGNGDAINNIYSATLSSGSGTFELADLLSDAGFDEAGERTVALVSTVPPTADDDLISALSDYGEYTLTGLPPSVFTSRERSFGTASDSSISNPRVYPSDTFTVTLTVDGLGRNSDLSADSVEGYAAVPIPDNTSFVAGSLDADVEPANFTYTTDLSSVDSGLPGVAGVYWHGTVTRTANLSFTLETTAPLSPGTYITPTAHIANGAFNSSPSQYFTDTGNAPVEVVSPLALSRASAQSGPTTLGKTARFTYTLINTDDSTREVDLTFTAPTSTTIQQIGFDTTQLSASAVSRTSDDQLKLTLDVPSYLETGNAKVVTIDLRLARDFSGDSVGLTTEVLQPDSTIPYVELDAGTVTVYEHQLFVPIIHKAASNP